MGRFWRKFGRGDDDADQQVKPGDSGAKPVTQSQSEHGAAPDPDGSEQPWVPGAAEGAVPVTEGSDSATADNLAPQPPVEAPAAAGEGEPLPGSLAAGKPADTGVAVLDHDSHVDSTATSDSVSTADAAQPDARVSITAAQPTAIVSDAVTPTGAVDMEPIDGATVAVPSIGPEADQVPEASAAPQPTDTPEMLEFPRTAVAADPTDAPHDRPASLAAGSVIANRFTIVRDLTAEAAADLLGSALQVSSARYFAVDDRMGYEHCWSCGSVNNDQNQRFCVDCGAPQRRESVLARTDLPSGEPDEFVDDGAYFHLVHPRKQFGSTGISLEVGAFSAEGPHHPNEDSYWLAIQGGCYDSHGETFGVAILADGMGGYAPGSGLISKAIVTTVGRGVFGLLNSEPDLDHDEASLRAVVKGAIANANGKVLDEIKMHGEMGATLVVAIIFGQTAYVANIGDSRAYYVSPAGTVAQLTRDQSLVEQQVALGRLSPDAVYTAIGNNVILHAVGEEAVEEVFDWYSQPLEPGSYLMLCSDGYWKTMQHAVWESQEATSQPSLRALARSMVENALAQNTDDNTTVVLVGID